MGGYLITTPAKRVCLSQGERGLDADVLWQQASQHAQLLRVGGDVARAQLLVERAERRIVRLEDGLLDGLG